MPRWLGVGTALLVCGCARPTLEEEERKLHLGEADAGAQSDEQDASTTVAKQPDASHQSMPDASNHAPSSGYRDAGLPPVPPPDSSTPTPVIDAGHREPDAATPPQDAGSTIPTNPPGCPTSEPSTFTGKPCFNFTSTCTYGNTDCHCGAVLWVCKTI